VARLTRLEGAWRCDGCRVLQMRSTCQYLLTAPADPTPLPEEMFLCPACADKARKAIRVREDWEDPQTG
jgi:hypothetical protein